MIRLRLEGLPRMANGGHGSWQRSAGERKKWAKLMARELAGLAPLKPYTLARISLTRCSSVEPDYDGLVHGFKPIIDSFVKLSFVVDDKKSNLIPDYKWLHAPARKGYILVEFEGLEK